MPTYEADNVELAIQRGLKDLKLENNEAEVSIISEGKKGFLGIGKKKSIVAIEKKPIVVFSEVKNEEEIRVDEIVTSGNFEAVSIVDEDLEDDEAVRQLVLYLTNISVEMNCSASVKFEKEDSLIIFHLDSKKQGMLIGKHGKILNALQYLAQVFIHRVAKNKIPVIVNVGDYREKRKAVLERLAQKTAEKVKHTGQPVFLEPMPAFERKQIHATLTKNPYVKTYSEGDEPYRYLVVEPERNII